MDPVSHLLSDVEQPRNARVRGLRHRALHVEMKDRLRSARSNFGQPSPAGVAATRRAVARDAVTNELDVGVVAIGRPVTLEILEKRGPVRRQLVTLKVAQ